MQKEGQISIEVMTSIAVLLVIFLITLAFTVSKRLEIARAEEYFERKGECDLLANAITQTSMLGDGAQSALSIDRNISIFNKSMLIMVWDQKERAFCSIEKLKIANYTNISGNLLIRNNLGKINITRLP